MREEEQEKVVRCIREVGGRAPLMAGIGSCSSIPR